MTQARARNASAGPPFGISDLKSQTTNRGAAPLISRWSHPTNLERPNTLKKSFTALPFGSSGDGLLTDDLGLGAGLEKGLRSGSSPAPDTG